jgi:hypothetical protein
MAVRLIEKTEPDQFWIPLKDDEEERLVRENLELFVALALEKFGYGSPQDLKVTREERNGSWSAKFTATMTNFHIVKGEVTYLPASNSLILVFAEGDTR